MYDDELGRKMRKTTEGAEDTREHVSLGSLNLAQFEEMKKRSDELLKVQNEQISALGDRKKMEEGLDNVIKKIKDMEEEGMRQNAMRTQEKRKIEVLEQEKSSLVEMVNKQ